jgi:DNA invertase Pin-like site-specific DNA recombinase
MQALLPDAKARKFDAVLAEALDRVSHGRADVATRCKHLQFEGAQIITLAEGTIFELHVGIKGTMNALFLKDQRRRDVSEKTSALTTQNSRKVSVPKS